MNKRFEEKYKLIMWHHNNGIPLTYWEESFKELFEATYAKS